MAIDGTSVSVCRKRLNFHFSVLAPGLVSAAKIGLQGKRLNPQWNSMSCLEGTTSLFSIVRLILKLMVDSFISVGNSVDKTKALPMGKLSASLASISRTTVRKVPLRGRPSSLVY